MSAVETASRVHLMLAGVNAQATDMRKCIKRIRRQWNIFARIKWLFEFYICHRWLRSVFVLLWILPEVYFARHFPTHILCTFIFLIYSHSMVVTCVWPRTVKCWYCWYTHTHNDEELKEICKVISALCRVCECIEKFVLYSHDKKLFQNWLSWFVFTHENVIKCFSWCVSRRDSLTECNSIFCLFYVDFSMCLRSIVPANAGLKWWEKLSTDYFRVRRKRLEIYGYFFICFFSRRSRCCYFFCFSTLSSSF